MNGAHRSTAPGSSLPWLKSAAWLATVAALITMLLAPAGLVGFAIYLSIAHQTDLRPLTIAVQGAALVAVLAHLAWTLIRRRPRSSAQRVQMLSEACLLLCITIGLLADSGDQFRWAHGPPGYAMGGASLALLLAIVACWVIGERQLRAARERHAAGRQRPSQ